MFKKYWEDFGSENNPLCWDQADKIYKNLKNTFGPPIWVFRGLNFYKDDNENNQLISSFDNILCHKGIDVTKRWCFEAYILREFRRKAHLFIKSENIPEPDDRLEWLSLMRHYLVPCRLVDFTYSFYIALYFALKKSEKEKVCVWAINSKWLNEENNQKLQKFRSRNVRKYRKLKDFHQPETFTRFFFSYNPQKVISGIFPVNPLRLNERLNQQRGLFLCPADISKTFEYNLIKGYNPVDLKKNIRRFIINSEPTSKKEILENLSRMNIDSSTLFPDFIGFCESLGDLFYLRIGSDFKDIENNLKSTITYKAKMY